RARMIRIERLPADVLERTPRPSAPAGADPIAAGMVPRNIADLSRPADRLETGEREALARQIEAPLARFSPHVAVLDAVRSLTEPGACAVVTGQQPGLYVSPLYCLYKALHAVRLARLLRERWSIPVIA